MENAVKVVMKNAMTCKKCGHPLFVEAKVLMPVKNDGEYEEVVEDVISIHTLKCSQFSPSNGLYPHIGPETGYDYDEKTGKVREWVEL